MLWTKNFPKRYTGFLKDTGTIPEHNLSLKYKSKYNHGISTLFFFFFWGVAHWNAVLADSFFFFKLDFII